MNNIKFRAWDSVQEKMLPVEIIDFKNGYITLNEGDNSVTDTFEIFKLMQSTGEKDKNGKEIYEGDIVKSDVALRDIFGKEYIAYVSVDLVISGCINLRNGSDLPAEKSFIEYIQHLEVIGNIYEDKELLD